MPCTCIQHPSTSPSAHRQPATRLSSPPSLHPGIRASSSCVCTHVHLSIICQFHCPLPEPRENKLRHPDPSPAVPRSPRTRESARITVTPSPHPGVLPGYSHLMCVPRATCRSGRRSQSRTGCCGDLQLSPCSLHGGEVPEGSGAGVCRSLSEPGCVLPSSGQRLW